MFRARTFRVPSSDAVFAASPDLCAFLNASSVFFAVAMSGATAMVGLFVGGMYATAVGGVSVLAKSAGNARLEGGRGGGARYVRHDLRFRRDHWD